MSTLIIITTLTAKHIVLYSYFFSVKSYLPLLAIKSLKILISPSSTCLRQCVADSRHRCPSADEWIRKLWYIYTMEYYSAINNYTFDSVLMRWMKLGPIIQSEVSQKEKHQYSILTHIYGI